jgi:hypothetical protein
LGVQGVAPVQFWQVQTAQSVEMPHAVPARLHFQMQFGEQVVLVVVVVVVGASVVVGGHVVVTLQVGVPVPPQQPDEITLPLPKT